MLCCCAVAVGHPSIFAAIVFRSHEELTTKTTMSQPGFFEAVESALNYMLAPGLKRDVDSGSLCCVFVDHCCRSVQNDCHLSAVDIRGNFKYDKIVLTVCTRGTHRSDVVARTSSTILNMMEMPDGANTLEFVYI